MFALCLCVILCSLSPQQHPDGVLIAAVEEHRLPAERGGGNSRSADCMPDVMVTVAECAFSILPRLTPLDGGQAEHKCTRRKWTKQPGRVDASGVCSELEAMFFRRVVVESGRQLEAVNEWREQVSLRRMQISRRRIAAQRPFRCSGPFPS